MSDNILIKLMGNGNYVFKNCVFDHINATGDHQSVIWLNYGQALLDNCTFTNCYCSFGAVTNYYTSWGTAVNNARMTVKDSTFRNNSATTEPGAINNCGKLIVYDTIFENNRATWWAGAIHTHSNANTTIVRSNFKNNIAGWNGGALYTYSYLTVIDSNFTSNVETTDYGGGAICASTYGSKPYVYVNNCNFITNTANGGKGGAISFTGAGSLDVYNSVFVDNVASSVPGHDLSYSYTGNSNTAAYFTYINNTFYGPNNASNSIYTYNNKLNVDNRSNVFLDSSLYIDPNEENNTNDTNGSSGTIIVPDNFNGNQLWNASLSGALGGTPLVEGDVIYVPNGHSIYCLNITNGNLLWNVSSPWGYFHELALHNGVLIAPCAWDKFYMYNATSGIEIQPDSNMFQASSYYAPAIDGNTIYVSSEYPYGDGSNKWIAVVEYVNGNYSYAGSILEINNVSSALISAPILWNNYLWVNTINGLVRYDLTANTYITPVVNAVGKPVVGGDYLYILTSDNHIKGVNATGSVVKDITVSGNVGSTLAINNDNTVLYTVNAEGEIYRAGVSSSSANYINRQINPVSSALTVGSDGYLYIGDDAGILWVINSYYSLWWRSSVVWAYNTTTTIHGEVINNNIVYVGTEDTFYALSNNNLLSNGINERVYAYDSILYNKNEKLCMNNQDNYLNAPIPDGTTLTMDIFKDGDTTYYLNGTYYVDSSIYVGMNPNDGSPVNNICIKPQDGANATIVLKRYVNMENPSSFYILGKNITIENVKFTTTSNYVNGLGLFFIVMDAEVHFKNCIFENCIDRDLSQKGAAIFFIAYMEELSLRPVNVQIDNCKFINCTMNKNIYISDADLTNISNCIFEKNTLISSEIVSEANIALNNNKFDSVNPIIIENNGKIVSDVSFNVLTDSLTVGEAGSIVAELVDDNGNRIKSSNLKFVINNEPTGIIAPDSNGLYTFEVTPSDASDIKVSASCSNVENFDVESIYIKVSKPSSNLTLGDDITFDYGESGSTTVSYEGATNVVAEVVNNTATIKIENGNITVSGLDAGNYTLKVTTVADDDHANVTKTVNITVNKVDCDINIMNQVIYVYGNVGQCSVFSAGVIDFTASIINHTEAIINIDSNGIVNVSGLNVGKYVLEVTANPDKNHNSITRQTNVTVSEAESQITIPNIVFTYGESGSVNATLVGATGITNASVLNHTEAVVNIVNNTITVSGLAAGSYVLQATTIPDANHNPVTATANITVNGVEVPADKAISTNVPANTKSPTFSIKLEKDATGTFTVNIDNGKIVKTAELKDGAASITVADLAAGDHTISVSYSGDGKYAPITQNTTLNIKEPAKPTTKVTKKATKITAKKATFKAKKKTKKYTITLKSGKKLISKVKVTIKVGKKTYSAKTNKKGKATFNLKKLTKKGKYTAVIKFKGNKYYKASSKKVKIILK